MILSFPILLNAQEVGLSAKSERREYRIGEWMDVTVEARVSVPIDTIGPAVRDSLGAFELLGAKKEEGTNRWMLRFTTLDSGMVVLPPVPFAYRAAGDTAFRRAYSNSLSFTVATMAVDAQGEIKDIKPPLPGAWTLEDLLPYILVCVVLAALAYGGYYLHKRRRQRLAQLVEDDRPEIPPHVVALTALRQLEEKKLWQAGKTKEFYSEVTEIIRRFFERRWNIIALELTTDEILAAMRRIPDAEPVRSEMRSFFQMADLVKFAKHQPSPEDCTNELRSAYEIVRVMVPRAAPEPVPQEEAPVDAR